MKIVMLSVKKLAARLSRPTNYLETVTSRMAFAIEFQRPSLDDAILVAKELIEGVTLDVDLVEDCWQRASGSYRALIDTFVQIERVSRASGVRQVNLPKWNQLAGVAISAEPDARTQKNFAMKRTAI